MYRSTKTLAACLALGILTLGACCPVTEAAEAGSAAVQTAVRAATEKAQGIQRVTSIARVYGDGEKPAAAVVEYSQVLAAGSLSAKDFTVEGREITAVYTNDKPELTTRNVPGRYAVVCFSEVNTVSDQPLQPKQPETKAKDNGQQKEGNDAPRYSNRQMPELSVKLSQVRTVKALDGTAYAPVTEPVQSEGVTESSLDGFQQYEYTDPGTGYKIPYQLYLPKDYDPAKKYPLLFFVADASANVENPKMVLVQGNGAAVWAEPSEQARHECIILAPAYTRGLVDSLDMLTTDSNTWTKGLTLVSDLLFDVMDRYSVDKDRVYGTGQSQGGMTNIAISDRYPDLFAAQYLVACQWNVEEMRALKDKNLWIMVCEGDTKAYPGMNAATALWEKLGSKVARSGMWDSKSTAAEFAALVKNTEAQKAKINYTVLKGGNHMYTWSVAYNIEGIRDWLFAQKKQDKSDQRQHGNEEARKALQLGLAYYQGSGVKQDNEKALDYFHQADQLGDFKAARYLGLCYENGTGVVQDNVQAVYWYQKAAANGDITGTCYLGRMYELGKGVKQDYAKAMELYLKSAERGDKIAAPGMIAAGRLYEKGLGAAKDLAKAKAYYQQALSAGAGAAAEDIKRIEEMD